MGVFRTDVNVKMRLPILIDDHRTHRSTRTPSAETHDFASSVMRPTFDQN